MMSVGDIMSTPGDVQYTGGTMSTPGVYHDECGGISRVHWGVFSTPGFYHEYTGGFP